VHGVTREEIAGLVAAVDYTNVLSVTATEREVREACAQARQYGFRAVVALPQYLGVLVDELKGTGVLAQIPVGYPGGGVTTRVKCFEAEEGLARGASDLDMVMNIGAFKAGDYAKVRDDIEAVMRVARPFHVPFKVIIEVGVLTEDEKVTAALLVRDCGADFVKTSTGFLPGKLSLHDITLIRDTVGESPRIKASGGVAALEDGVACLRAGASVVAMRHRLIEQLEKLVWPTRPAPAAP
jgi:deoxyribose-phosphate aldolase